MSQYVRAGRIYVMKTFQIRLVAYHSINGNEYEKVKIRTNTYFYAIFASPRMRSDTEHARFTVQPCALVMVHPCTRIVVHPRASIVVNPCTRGLPNEWKSTEQKHENMLINYERCKKLLKRFQNMHTTKSCLPVKRFSISRRNSNTKVTTYMPTFVLRPKTTF